LELCSKQIHSLSKGSFGPPYTSFYGRPFFRSDDQYVSFQEVKVSYTSSLLVYPLNPIYHYPSDVSSIPKPYSIRIQYRDSIISYKPRCRTDHQGLTSYCLGDFEGIPYRVRCTLETRIGHNGNPEIPLIAKFQPFLHELDSSSSDCNH
jgi:hypothetical protein